MQQGRCLRTGPAAGRAFKRAKRAGVTASPVRLETKGQSAVPLLALLPPLDDRFDTLEARATDGYAAQLPISLLQRAGKGGAVPWLAIEPPGHPWP